MTVLQQLAVRSNGLRIRVWFNGLDVANEDEGETLRTDVPLNEWLMPSGNVLTVEVTPPEAPHKAGSDVSVVVRPPSDDPSEPKPASQGFTWKFPAGEQLEPFRVSFPVVVSSKVPSKLWDGALPIGEIEGDDRKHAVALAEQVVAAFASADVSKVLEVMKFRTAELAAVFLNDPAETLAEVTTGYAGIFKADGFKVRPVSPTKLRFTKVCGGKLVKVTDADGPSLSVDVYFAKTKDGWVVAR